MPKPSIGSGSSQAKQYADANQAAIEMVASLVREYDIPCDFVRKPAYTYAESEEEGSGRGGSGCGTKPSAFRRRCGGRPVAGQNLRQYGSRPGAVPSIKIPPYLASLIPGDGAGSLRRPGRSRSRTAADGVRSGRRTDYHVPAVVLATHYPSTTAPGSTLPGWSPRAPT